MNLIVSTIATTELASIEKVTERADWWDKLGKSSCPMGVPYPRLQLQAIGKIAVVAILQANNFQDGINQRGL